MDYPADYKLFAVGGGNFNLAALGSGQIGATYLVVPLDYIAEQQGFNVLGYFKDYFPNYQLSLLTVKRAWAEKNRALLVRFLKGAVRAHRWLYANKEAAIDFLAKEIPLKPELARRGWEYYTANRIWHPNAEINLEGLKFTMQVYAEQIKGPPPDPLKYIDHELSATGDSRIERAISREGEKSMSHHNHCVARSRRYFDVSFAPSRRSRKNSHLGPRSEFELLIDFFRGCERIFQGRRIGK